MKSIIWNRSGALAAMLLGALLVSGCGTPRERELAGLYVLNASAVRDSAAEQIDDIEDPSQQMAMGMALSMLQSLTISLHLESDGTAYVTGIEPQQRGTWSAEGNRIVAMLGVEGDDRDRYEGTLREGWLVVPAGGASELPFELVFERRLDE
jgi:hypothetical protein